MRVMSMLALLTADGMLTVSRRASPGRIVPLAGNTDTAVLSDSVVLVRAIKNSCAASFELTTYVNASALRGLVARVICVSGTITVLIASVGRGVGRWVGAGVGASVFEVGGAEMVGPGVGCGVGVIRQGFARACKAATSSA